MPKQVISRSFYAVRRGHQHGIYKTWAECKQQVDGYSSPHFRKFATFEEAQEFMNDGKVKLMDGKIKYERSKGSAMASSSSSNSSNNSNNNSNTGTTTTTTTTPTTTIKNKDTEIKADEIVYTDGAASKNGQKGAKGGYGVFWGIHDTRNEGGPLEGEKQTNQRGELTAVLRALEQSKKGTKSLEIRTDSQYTINCIDNWSIKWLKNGWKSSNGKQVDNRDLVEKILNLKKARPGKVFLTYVAGHSGNFGNDNADRLAVEGAKQGRIVKDVI
ncbi:hypothetical protein INT45_005921 [Circinella minor]|uniref:Ribonuclease H n=1 Tax=Circinella minor TaxID=1195481 RepID=A0A8H7SBD5_9FUNG|nr:hypothetical protein INT45_005921 [Circinella minor]